jgi:hypothetical protein
VAVTDPAVQRLLDIEAIKQLKHRYFRAMDAKAWDTFAAMFTPDAEITFGRGERQLLPPDVRRSDDGRFWVTRDELVSWMADGMRDYTTVHQAFMPEITILGAGRATGVWSMTDATRLASDPMAPWYRAYAVYEDEYVHGEGGWRICRSTYSRSEFDPIVDTGPA